MFPVTMGEACGPNCFSDLGEKKRAGPILGGHVDGGDRGESPILKAPPCWPVR